MENDLAKENLIKTRSSRGYEEICGKVEAACQEQGFALLSQFDLGEKLRSKGVEFGGACRIFEFCEPRGAAAVLRESMDVAALLPCRLAIYQSAESGGDTILSSVAPTNLLSLIGVPAARQEVEAIEDSVRAIITTLAS